jgi:hypothetical protein
MLFIKSDANLNSGLNPGLKSAIRIKSGFEIRNPVSIRILNLKSGLNPDFNLSPSMGGKFALFLFDIFLTL